MRTHHVVPIRRRHYPQLVALIEAGHLHHDPAAKLQHDRPPGLVYRPVRQVPLEAPSDTEVRLGTVAISADLWRLPTAEHAALAGGTPPHPAVQAIRNALSAGVSRDGLRTLLDHPPKDRGACATDQEAHVLATWSPEEWAMMRLAGHWFLVLWFDLTGVPHDPAAQTEEVALDVGLDPVVCAVTATGRSWQVRPASPADLLSLRASLGASGRQLLDRALFEHSRHALLSFTASLASQAATVYTEDLTYRDMSRPFVREARRLGILDWQECWLHTRLQLAGVRLERVDPTGTSQRCSRCDRQPYGQRRAHLFVCRVCGSWNAHENAARNILRLGREKAKRWDARQAVADLGAPV